MFSHVMVGSNDLERSKRFYDALFEKPGRQDDKGRLSYGRRGSVFMVSMPIDGEPATYANGSTIGFTYDTPEEVDAWQKRGTEAGGQAIEDRAREEVDKQVEKGKQRVNDEIDKGQKRIEDEVTNAQDRVSQGVDDAQKEAEKRAGGGQ